MKHRRQFACTFVISLLMVATGCDTTRHRQAWEKLYGVPVNSTVTVHRQLTIPRRDTQVFLQEGTTEFDQGLFGGTLFGGYNDYYPFCYFELADIAKTEQYIEPDSFTVTTVYREEADMIIQSPPRTPGQGIEVGDTDDGGIRIIVQMTVMRLHSSRQPNVKMLACTAGFEFEPFARQPTIDEIRLTLGDYATLTLAGEQ